MANGKGFDVQGLLANPLFNVGTGLLAAGLDSPRSFGQALGQGLQFGRQQQTAAVRNQLVRERVLANQAALKAQTRRENALKMLQSRLQGDDTQGPLGREEALGLLSEIAPAQTAQSLLGQILPPQQRATGFSRNKAELVAEGLARGLTRPQAEDRANKLLKQGGTTVNVGTPLKPFTPAELKNLRTPEGDIPPIGTTPADAKALGLTVLTTEQQKSLDTAGKFKPVMDRLEKLALGKGGVFTNVKPGLANRFRAGMDLFISSLDRQNPNVAEFDSLAKGTVAPIIRQLGDAGALSDGDVKRALGLLPQIQGDFLLPDTREDAKRKLDTLRSILERGEKKLRGTLGSKRTPRAGRKPSAGKIPFSELPD